MRKIGHDEIAASLQTERPLFFNTGRTTLGDKFAIGVMLIAVLLGACDQKASHTNEVNHATAVAGAVAVLSTAASVESSSNLLAIQASEESEFRRSYVARLMEEVYAPRAFAAVSSCTHSAAFDSCSGLSTKTAQYRNCPIGLSDLTYSGSVTLDYSNSSACSLAAPNQTLTRTTNLTRNTTSGGQVSTSSDIHQDYRENNIGGGIRITRTTIGYALSVLGQHIQRQNAAGEEVFNISARTLQDFEITNPKSTPLTIDGGELEIVHNNAQYVATFSADNLQYNTTMCCYPISGRLHVTYTDALTGTGVVSFGPGCGDLTYTQDGKEVDVELASCQ